MVKMIRGTPKFLHLQQALALVYFPNRLKLVNFIYIYIVYLSGPEVPLPPWLWDLSGKFSEFRVFRLA